MTQEEIIRQGTPIEPHCFETDREEQWYKLGLYDGATANPWHSVADGDLPKKDGRYLTLSKNSKGYHSCVHEYQACNGGYWSTFGYQSDICYWMEIPQLPEKGGTE
ncbi:MAG: hypothetical protein SPF56_08525 [Bacteroidaceae bacterium]|nr:hypothetical protein [Bacteroidaceae bacterium]